MLRHMLAGPVQWSRSGLGHGLMVRTIREKLTRANGHEGRRREWERRGLIGPVRIMCRSDAAGIGRDFQLQYERSGIALTRNRHVDLPVLAALLEAPAIWRPAHEILGDRLLLWRTNMFLDNPVLPWHEDRYAGLFSREAFSLSVILALKDSPPDNCTVFVPGSHRLTPREKERRYGLEARPQASGNVRYAGRVAARSCEFLALDAGEMIVFHPGSLHASSGWVNGGTDAPAGRMSITFRVTVPDATLREEAFIHGVGDRNAVLRAVVRTSDAVG